MTVRSSQDGPGDDASARHSDDEIDFLLSRGSLGGAQRSRILDAVAASVSRHRSPSPGRSARGWPWMVTAGATVAMVACFVVWTRSSVGPEAFRSKGNVAPAPVAIDVTCLRAKLTACPRGSLLAFSVRDALPELFVTAYLQPAGLAPRVRLLTNEPVSAQVLAGGGLLARGARIPDNQDPGSYEIEVLVTRRPLSREHAVPRAEDLVARARFGGTVLP